MDEIPARLCVHIKCFRQLSARWREKSDLIGSLEKQVSNMKNTWEEREKRLTQERDQAKEAARLVSVLRIT